jgi:hypothetical protein
VDEAATAGGSGIGHFGEARRLLCASGQEANMNRIARGLLLMALVAVAPRAFAGDKMKPGKCTFAKMDRVKAHAGDHIKYPAKGKDIKDACKKEWPDEFSKDEWACIDASIKDDKEYKSAGEVLEAIGVK